jgi:formamidopyrimidine-DNA glycosylase
MPELPEVQTVVNDLNTAALPGQTITAARVFWPRTVAPLTPEAFCRQIRGQRIDTIWRRAKYIVFDFSGGAHLLIHLRMSGRLHLAAPAAPRAKHEHLILELDGGRHLRFHDTRKFGRALLLDDAEPVLGKLGPEPLADDFTAAVLADGLRQRKRQLKPLLLDQTFLAGLGNIYADEALWEARLHPCRIAASLTPAEAQALHRAIRLVLQRGITNLGTTLGAGQANFSSVGRRTGSNREQLNVFRRTAAPCPRCQTPIQRIVVGQRSTHVCPVCQTLER